MKKTTVQWGFIGLAVSIVLACIDQFIKALAVMYIKPEPTISLIRFGDTEVLNLTYCENTGMSFSMFEGQTVLLTVLPAVLIGLVEWFIFSGKVKRKDVVIALAALAGGGIGNLIDRIFNGFVVDFIDFRLINFAIFNFADICAVCGGIYFAVVLLIEEHKEEKAKKAGETAENADDTPAETPDEQS